MSRHRQRERSLARQAGTAAAPGAAAAGATIAARATADPAAATGRRPAIDALRGIAICLMVVYHFSFDLRRYHLIAADFESDPFWLGFRALIVTSFLTLAGVSLVLADAAGTPPAKFAKRVALIIACALAVSVVSYVDAPRRFIYFGILHCIALASLLAWPLRRRPRAALAAGLAIVAAGLTLSHPAFDPRALSWLGFTTMKPPTEDYVPLAPWAGVVLIGVAIGRAVVGSRHRGHGALAAAPQWLRWLGRHSLAVYMVHQPLLLGLLWLAVRLRGLG